jgi:hypothetical protein
VFNIEKEVCGVLHSFLSTSKEYEKEKNLWHFFLMLDPRFKCLYLVSSFIGREQGISIGEIAQHWW